MIRVKNKKLEVYPTNWLMNVCWVGLLRSIEEIEGNPVEDFFHKDGRIEFPLELFSKLDLDQRFFDDDRKIAAIKGKSKQFPNYIQHHKNYIDTFRQFVHCLSEVGESKATPCLICGSQITFSRESENELIKTFGKGEKEYKENFLGIQEFSMRHSAWLGASEGEHPNSFWNMKSNQHICPICAFLILFHYYGFTQVYSQNYQRIFINAPSFLVMFKMNEYMRNIFRNKSTWELREILGFSLMEYIVRMEASLRQWTQLNIEVVSKTNKGFDFFTLPEQSMELLTDRRIASLCRRIGEFSVLRNVLAGEFSQLVEDGGRLMMESLTNRRDFTNDYLYLWRNKKSPLAIRNTAQSIFKLYSLINNHFSRKGDLG
jgi:CRISPR-associated protein Cst1